MLTGSSIARTNLASPTSRPAVTGDSEATWDETRSKRASTYTGPCNVFADNFNYFHLKTTKVAQWVEHAKNVIIYDPLLTGHVIRRMRSGRVRIFNGNQRDTL